MTSKNTEIILERIKNSELSAGRKRHDELPQLLFLFGICIGFVLNLTASIVFELIKTNNTAQIIVLFIALLLLSTCWYWIHKFYVKPVHSLEKKIDDDFEKLKKLLVK